MRFNFLIFSLIDVISFLTLPLFLVILGVQLLSESCEVMLETFGGFGVVTIDSEGIKGACGEFVLFVSMEFNWEVIIIGVFFLELGKKLVGLMGFYCKYLEFVWKVEKVHVACVLVEEPSSVL